MRHAASGVSSVTPGDGLTLVTNKIGRPEGPWAIERAVRAARELAVYARRSESPAESILILRISNCGGPGIRGLQRQIRSHVVVELELFRASWLLSVDAEGQ